MEKWSSIHNTFKFFKLGRPPKLEEMEESPTWEKRLKMMNRVKNYYKKNDLAAPNLSDLPYQKIDIELREILARTGSVDKSS